MFARFPHWSNRLGSLAFDIALPMLGDASHPRNLGRFAFITQNTTLKLFVRAQVGVAAVCGIGQEKHGSRRTSLSNGPMADSLSTSLSRRYGKLPDGAEWLES